MRGAFAKEVTRALVALCVVLAAAAPICAAAQQRTQSEGPIVHNDIDYLDVTGNSKRELVESLDRLSVADDNGKRFYGHTRWELRWNFNVTSEGTECRVTSVSVELNVRTSLPRWDPPRNADPALIRRWDVFLDGLRMHEEGHRDIALAAADEITQRIEAVRPAASCATLKRTVGIRANSLLAEYREKSRRYDQTTDHGRTQGAVLR
ncbi:MAG: DUF922 domain-containing Zn-dependent protease, partial [Rhodanobacteraceae bacterium]